MHYLDSYQQEILSGDVNLDSLKSWLGTVAENKEPLVNTIQRSKGVDMPEPEVVEDGKMVAELYVTDRIQKEARNTVAAIAEIASDADALGKELFDFHEETGANTVQLRGILHNIRDDFIQALSLVRAETFIDDVRSRPTEYARLEAEAKKAYGDEKDVILDFVTDYIEQLLESKF